VNRSLPYFRLLTVLCCAALLCAQAFGVSRGYWCDCEGQVEWTAQDHCHGPHHDDCHDDEAPGHEHHDEESAGDRLQHQQVRDDVQGRCLPAIAVPCAVPVLLTVFHEDSEWSSRVFPVAPRADWDVGTGPPPGVAVARTTVLLI